MALDSSVAGAPSWMRSLWALALTAAACGAPGPGPAPVFRAGTFHPPAKPGDSYMNTQMCECKVCAPASCCEGPEDDVPSAACGDSYDFSAGGACGGISVRSCSSRCTRQVWRVHRGVDCDTKRPSACC